MKLEDLFFKSFFYPFLIGVFLSTLVVTIFLGLFTNNNYDKKTRENIINLERKFSKSTINSANVLMSASLLKLQASLNEQILSYQKISKKLLNSNESHEIKTDYMKCALDVDEEYCEENYEESKTLAVWLLDDITNVEDLDDDDSKSNVKQQLIAYSNIIPNINSIYEASTPDVLCYYFYFVKTELYTSYPISSDCDNELIYFLKKDLEEEDFEDEEEFSTCLDEEGEYYNIYKIKCESFFIDMQKSKTGAFDNNYISNRNKTIFITNFYNYVDDDTRRELTMCIEFDDPISQDKGYACVDVYNEDMVNTFENLNANIKGYYFISNVGFSNVFYYPQGPISPRTSIENIFKWEINYKLDEKIQFYKKLRKIFSSNYLDYIGDTLFDEIYVNGNNSSEQYFSLNGKVLNYSIYPVILENLNGEKEHIFSIIYIYNEDLFFDEIDQYNSSMAVKIILELILFLVFGFGLLYIIYLVLNLLSKYIVIPIKNVNYMLRGINIGGEYRLKYLHYLHKKQEDNLEKLEKMYLFETKQNAKENNLNEETDRDFINNELNSDNLNNKEKNKNETINIYADFNHKYDEESNYIEKEIRFYDFDEQLLQFRPLELELLVKTLMDLKSALILTSSNRHIEEIIKFSHSENVFGSIKNKEGATICQSNIGNLESQLLKFDKAIYHLALSLQDNKLNRFLNRNLNDELDESDSLLNNISNSFNKEKRKEKKNILMIKQMNNSKDNFSQKLIGILINTRYGKLIYAYYMFFKNLQKLQKSNSDIISGQFMNTSFHTINYYHKIVIQFIYLSYIKNDLVKIGESILDYIEFLIKFKFKTSLNDKTFLNIKYKDRSKFRKKIEFKKKIFNKIIKWFNLFDDYVSHVKDNSSLGDIKSILDDYSNLHSDKNEFNLETQSTFMFRINIQKSEFLKGKFCLSCKNYNDALFYFIRSSKKKSIVIDGLLKKRSLKHIFKLLKKMKKQFNYFRLNKLFKDKELKEFKKDNYKIYNKKIYIGKKGSNRSKTGDSINDITFGEELERIKTDIIYDINACNAKEEKDIIILIDFNIYNTQEVNEDINIYKIEAFIEQTIIILNKYLSANDRLGVLIYTNKCQIICPIMTVNEIDFNNFSKDLFYYKNITFKENNEDGEYDIDFNEFNSGGNISEQSKEDSSEESEVVENNKNKIKGLVKAINFLNIYSIMKEGIKNEKYYILFTDIFYLLLDENEKYEKYLKKIKGDRDSILLLVGKNKKLNSNERINNIEELILSKFRDKSEVINFENMKKIKTILSNNNVIKDEIIFPNEIYK